MTASEDRSGAAPTVFSDQTFTHVLPAPLDQPWVGLRFVRCRFVDADLKELVTEACVFDQCFLAGARLNASRHDRTAFLNSSLVGASLFEARFIGCKMTGSQFAEAVWSGISVEGGDWSYTGLTRARWSGCRPGAINLSEADLTEADLRGCHLEGANLERAILRGAKLSGAVLRNARLGGIDFRAVDLNGVRLDLLQAADVLRAWGAVVE